MPSETKVVTKKLIGFTQPMLEALDAERARRRKIRGRIVTQTEVLEDLLVGAEKFTPSVEVWIADRMRETGGTRGEVIQIALWDLVQEAKKTQSITRDQARMEEVEKRIRSAASSSHIRPRQG